MDLETRKKISRTMKGKSNFEGHRHTHSTKLQIGWSMEGKKNAKGTKWTTDKNTGDEHRVRHGLPKGNRWGRKSSSVTEQSTTPVDRLIGTLKLAKTYASDTPGQKPQSFKNWCK